jgi:hypothetical protein
VFCSAKKGKKEEGREGEKGGEEKKTNKEKE